ncbi:MAG: hypothetical protein IAF38_03860 [Bacteroidia bacterium]|nr:hypothetical protein [Bacteroidia bacterium]
MMRIFLFLLSFFPLFFFAQKEEILSGKWELVLEKRGDCGDSLLVKTFKETSLLNGTSKLLSLETNGKFECDQFLGEKYKTGKWKVISNEKEKAIVFYGNKKSSDLSFLSFKFVFMSDEKIILMGGSESCKYYLLKKLPS